jgi:hypothetical protein
MDIERDVPKKRQVAVSRIISPVVVLLDPK